MHMPLKRMLYKGNCLFYHSSKPLLLPFSRLRLGWSRLPSRKSSCEGFDFVPDGLLQILSNGLVLTSGTVTLDLGVRVVKYESQSVSFCCSLCCPPHLSHLSPSQATTNRVNPNGRLTSSFNSASRKHILRLAKLREFFSCKTNSDLTCKIIVVKELYHLHQIERIFTNWFLSWSNNLRANLIGLAKMSKWHASPPHLKCAQI